MIILINKKVTWEGLPKWIGCELFWQVVLGSSACLVYSRLRQTSSPSPLSGLQNTEYDINLIGWF